MAAGVATAQCRLAVRAASHSARIATNAAPGLAWASGLSEIARCLRAAEGALSAAIALPHTGCTEQAGSLKHTLAAPESAAVPSAEIQRVSLASMWRDVQVGVLVATV